jgi:hypothetical protein
MSSERKSIDTRGAVEFVREGTGRSARREELSAELWARSADDRVAAMRAGELTWSQLCEWARRRPHEVPMLHGEFEFIAVLTPEWAEAEEGARRGR